MTEEVLEEIGEAVLGAGQRFGQTPGPAEEISAETQPGLPLVGDDGSAAEELDGHGVAPALRVCERCQARQRSFGAAPEVAYLADDLRRRAQGDPGSGPLHVLEVGCMKVCPQDGVAVSAGRAVPVGTVVRSSREADELLHLWKTEAAGKEPSWAERFVPRRRALRRMQRLERQAAEPPASDFV